MRLLCNDHGQWVDVKIKSTQVWIRTIHVLVNLCGGSRSYQGISYASIQIFTGLNVLETNQCQQFLYMSTVPYPLSVAFTKLAILFQYLRIFQTSSTYRLVCKTLIIIVALWGCVYSVMIWVPCIPVAAYWDLSITDAKCYGFSGRQLREFMDYFVSQVVSSSVLDFIVFLLPIRLYFRPNTKGHVHLSLLCFFALGLWYGFFFSF